MQHNNDAIAQAMAMANSSAGKQLLKMLQQSGCVDLEKMKASAAAGDYTAVQQNLSGFLNNPEVKKLLRQMGGSHGADGR